MARQSMGIVVKIERWWRGGKYNSKKTRRRDFIQSEIRDKWQAIR
jgi:hypothetical protein